MSDDNKSTNIQLICNQHVLTYNKLRGLNTMGLSIPWGDDTEVIALHTLKQCKG